ncbi:MAG: hypothetical protein ACRC8D_08575 [Aeromonas sp.]
MTKQIHDIAVKALNDLKAKGINKGGRSWFNSFKEAKTLTQQWAQELRADVVGDDRIPNSTRATFLFITSYATSLTLRGWTDLTRWLSAAEEELNKLIEQHKPMTYVKHRTSGRVRIFAEGADNSSNTYTQDSNGGWIVSALTVGQAKADIANGSAYLCDERGEPLEREAGPLNATEWAYFQCLPISGRAQNVRRVNLNCAADSKAHILIDGEWHKSDVTLADLRHMTAMGQAEWVEAPKLKMTKPAAETPVKATARKMLELMEKRGFGADMVITKMWDDTKEVCGLARSLRLQLITINGHTGNGLSMEETCKLRGLIDLAPTRLCTIPTLEAGWKKLHHELTRIVLI